MKNFRFYFSFIILLTGIFFVSSCQFINSVIKKERDEYARNHIDTSNKIVSKALQDGNEAYNNKDFDLAVTKFDEGYTADPTYAGSAPVLLNNKALALIARGTAQYNKFLKSDEATKNSAKAAAKNDFEAAIESSEKALEILKTADFADQNYRKSFELNTLAAFTNRKNCYRLLSQTGTDRTKGKAAVSVFREYLAVEPDSSKKSKAALELALTLQDSDEPELAITEFKNILANDPQNADAPAGVGLNLVNVGYANEDTERGQKQLREAAEYLQQYLSVAPESHKFKKEAKGIIESILDAEKIPGVAKRTNLPKGIYNSSSANKQSSSATNSVGFAEKTN